MTRIPSPTPGSRSIWRGLRAVVRHELRSLAYAPIAPVFLGGFLVALSAAIFIAGDFYSSDQASAALMWTFLPWVALVFVPALAMRAFTAEQGDRSLELMQSLPLPSTAIVTGKWLAGTALLAFVLTGTAPFVLTLAFLGSPDWGALATGYLGALLLLAVFFALALLAASLTREAAAAYVLGLVLLLLLIVAGWDAAQKAAAGTPFAWLAEGAERLSPKLWLDRMATGRIELGALASFLAVTAAALIATHAALLRRRASQSANRKLTGTPTHLAAVTLLLVAVAAFADRLPQVADFSAGRAYTLHPETIAAARSVAPGTRVDLYWSAGEARVPSSIRTHAARVRSLLTDLARHSEGRLLFTLHETAPENDAEAAALAAGLRRIPMSSGDSFVLGATFAHGERQGTITYLDIRREALVEYDIAQALSSLARPRTPRIGLLTPLLTPRNVSEPREGLAVLEELKSAYDVAIIPFFADAIPDDLDAVVLIGASVLKPEMLYSLDQHVMRGKGLIVLIDPHTRFNASSDMVVPRPSTEVNDISDVLLRYGVRFDPDSVVGDASLAAQVAGSDETRINYPFWMRLGSNELSADHAVTASLNEILLAEAGSFAVERPERVTPLIVTGPSSGALSRAEAEGKSADALAAMFKSDGKSRVLAAALSGSLESAFDGPPAPKDGGAAHLATSTGAPVVFAVADTDFVFDPLSLENVVTGERSHTRPINDNLTFLLNMVESAAGDPRLLAIRSRGTVQRPFNRVATMLGEAQARHREEEARLLAAISKVEGDIAKVLRIAGVKDASELPNDIRDKIKTLISGLQPYKSQLRQIRLGMREEVERLGTRLLAANLAAGPLIALAFSFAARWWRRRRHAALAV